MVQIKTNTGQIIIELFQDKSPVTADNFLKYVTDGFYDGTIFHRVIPGFIIQGGGFDSGMNQLSTRSPIENEAGNGLQNTRGTIAMARTGMVNSATSQFFINVADNAFLNHRDRTPQGFGYCVFGRVKDGMDILDKITSTPTTTRAGHENVPVQPVEILEARLLEKE